MSQLRDLAEPFPDKLVKAAPQGKYGSYVAHSTVTERLLSIVGPFSQRVAQILYGPDGTTIEGCVLELELTIDGRDVVVQEAGDCERPENWKTNGARLKDAVSDAFKRCSMRPGLGLHLWSQSDYFLDKQLDHDAPKSAADEEWDSTPQIRTQRVGTKSILERSSTGGGVPDSGEADTDTPTQRGTPTMHQKVFGKDRPADPDTPTLDEVVLGQRELLDE